MPTWTTLLAAAWLAALPLAAQDDARPAPAEEEAVPAPSESTYLDTVTVTATRSERVLKDTPGQIDVITALEITELGYTSITDLVRYTPGVYVAGDPTRLGANGFSIRGIGGNRVLTQIDGIPAAEQFDFGPLGTPQFSLDVETLERAEIVRSAGSALYGSDALGGVVSLVTRSPKSYLGGRSRYLGLRAGYDGRADELCESVIYAQGNDRWQGSLVYSRRDGEALDNQGDVASESFTRTAPNPIDRRQDNLLLKLARSASPSSSLEVAFEGFDSRAETEVYSSRAPASPFAPAILDFDAVDEQERQRLSLEHNLVRETFASDVLLTRVYWQDAATEQDVAELRSFALGNVQRAGLLSFDQTTTGIEAEVHKALGRTDDKTLTYGLSLRRDHFEQLRDRLDTRNGVVLPSLLPFPTRYFPDSRVDELGLFVQGELALFGGRLRAVPGVRFDRYDLDADQDDAIYLSGNPGTPPPADITDEAVSPKLGLVLSLGQKLSLFTQYAHGFRAPPMSAVNNGFTNPAGGYRTLANPDLQPETSDNLELGLRGAFARGGFSVVVFDNRYDDFIETITIGINPQDFLIEFQPQNVDAVTIRGVELSGDWRLGEAWRIRGAYTWIEGDNDTLDQPLESIAPPALVTGLRYQGDGSRWGIEATATVAAAKDADDLPEDSTQFRTPGYEVFDLAAWWTVNDRLTLQLSAWNLGDETYWIWPFARGQAQGSATLDRYTQPGRSFGLQARLNF